MSIMIDVEKVFAPVSMDLPKLPELKHLLYWRCLNDIENRYWLMRTNSPSFIARLVWVDEDGLPVEEIDKNADVVSGLTMSAYDVWGDKVLLCEFRWFEQDVAPEMIDQIREEFVAVMDTAA